MSGAVIFASRNHPKDSYIEVDGRRIEGVHAVVVSSDIEGEEMVFTVHGKRHREGFDVVWAQEESA